MNNYSAIFLIIFLFSCNQEKNNELSFQSVTAPKTIEAKGYLVPKDSMAEPDLIFIDESKLKKIPVKNPKVVFTNLNVHTVGIPNVIPAGNPKIITPDTDTFPLPKIVPAIDSPFIAKQPKPISALPLRMKDAANCNIQYLDVDQGMNSSYVSSVLEDKSGNLWFGTGGGGVSKYDGKSFTHYTENEGLNSNYVRSMLEDKRGNLWFGTGGGGVSKYDGKSFTHYNVKEGLSGNSVCSILEDKFGNLWFATDDGGVSKFDGNRVEEIEAKLKRGEPISEREQQGLKKENGKFIKTFTHYTVKEGLSSNTVWCILEDKSGNLWFCINGGGVTKYDGNRVEEIEAKLKRGESISNREQQGLKKENGKFIKSFTNYTFNEGLGSNTVLSILEDKSGNLWFGTYGGGVSKFDGNRVEEIEAKLKRGEPISEREQQGLKKENGKFIKTFTHYTVKEGLSSNTVWWIFEDKSGNLWFATHDGGVSKFDGNRVEEIEAKLKRGESISEREQHGFKKENGKLVKSFTHYTVKEGLSSNTVYSILEDKSGNLWFITEGGGVSKYDRNSFMHYTDKEGLSNSSVSSIIEDKRGNLWFGTNGGGVSKYDGKSFTHYTENEGLSNNNIKSILEDKFGNLWFCTNGGGISKYDGNRVEEIEAKLKRGESISELEQHGLKKENGKLVKSFTHYTDKEGLSNNTVLSIIEDKRGNLWFGTYGGGVLKYDGNRVEEVEAKLKRGESISDREQQGLKKENGKLVKSFTYYTIKEGMSDNIVWKILEDKPGNLWFATNGGGVTKYDGNRVEEIEAKLKRGESISEREQQGLKKENGKLVKSFTHYTIKEGMSSNTVLSILEDKSGNLWFGTNGGGVTKYDGNRVEEIEAKLKRGEPISDREQQGLKKENGKLVKSFTHYTDKEGLSSNTVWSILEDGQQSVSDGVSKSGGGNLWLSTEKGLNCFVVSEGGSSHSTLHNGEDNPDSYRDNHKILVFKNDDGLKAEDFFQNSVLLDSKNRIWWGSGKALSMIDMNLFKHIEIAPEIQLNNIYLQENFVDYKSLKAELKGSTEFNENDELKKIKFSGVADFYNYPIELELPYNLNHLTFHFSAIDWYAPHKIKYQYKLEGLDRDWSNLISENKADYRNIPFGKYTFKVKAIGSAGKWSKTFEYEFVIHPPWWLAWWAYILYGLFIISIVVFIVRWNSKKLRARAEELKIKVNEATQEIKEQKALAEEQKHIIEERHKEITDSINYAERIQRSLLASKKLLDENLNEYFIFFKPKDVVSGDFYWATKLNNGYFSLVCADSTGHGVPGAIMSILNIACLKEASMQGITSSDLFLNETRRLVIENLKNDGSVEGGKDGMDGSLLSFDFKNNKLQCASANNPVWIIRNKELIEIKADRYPIGKHDRDEEPFTLHTIDLQKGDVVYSLTDGFPDQFGGLAGKKFKYKQLQELLLSIAHEPLSVQNQKLNDVFNNWKGNLEQVDDVTIVGVKI